MKDIKSINPTLFPFIKRFDSMQLNYKYKQSKHAGVMAFKYGTHENEICKWAVDFTKEHEKTCLIRCFDHS